MKIIARYYGQFPSKFGVPKQAGLVPELQGRIIFEPEYRNPDYIRGIEGFDYLWLIWEFSQNKHAATSPVVRPPVLGGNTRVGVFATRSPFRPNNIGLSSVKLETVELETPEGPVLHIAGADLVDGTPIFDIKPYIEYADSHVNVKSGFVDTNPIRKLEVGFAPEVDSQLSKEDKEILRNVLELDPRPHYHKDDNKVYGMPYKCWDIKFKVHPSPSNGEECLTVFSLD